MIVGVMGGGQLGRMLALAGAALGLRFRFLDPDPDCPAGQCGELIIGAYDDEGCLGRLVAGVAAVTYEFENVPARTAAWLTDHASVFPPQRALEIAQDRVLEKRLFASHGVATPAYQLVGTREELKSAIASIGLPAVLKTRRLGYDGKGQSVLRNVGDLERAWREVGSPPAAGADLVLEALVPFAREISALAVRGRDGSTAFYPLVENRHDRGILARSEAPAANISPDRRVAYERACSRVLDALGYVGVLAIEFFEMPDGRILANEMAPRVHNSGHWTIEGAQTSQFENHLRAVLGLPVGSTAARGHSVMLNIIGAEPDVTGLLAIPDVHLHMYGKTPRPGRKLGHATITTDRREGSESVALNASRFLRNC